MAHATQVQSLLQDLIKSHDFPTTEGSETPKLEENASQLLSDDRFGRTNQFEVKFRLEGLVEKSRILNKESLGNALQTRLDELSTVSNKWTPEVLSLLLHLSDRPVHKTRVEDLALLEPKESSAPLTWEDIIKDDPLEDQTAIWRDIDFAADGSEEDEYASLLSSQASAGEGDHEEPLTEDTEVDLDALVVPFDEKALDILSDAQDWRSQFARSEEQQSNDKDEAFQITELVAIREVVFMLLGLSTTIFGQDRGGKLAMNRKISLRNVSLESTTDLFGAFIELGQKLCTIRRWIMTKVDVPLEQVFQSVLHSRLKLIDSTFYTIQARLLNRSNTRVASLLDVYDETCMSSRLILQLHGILEGLNSVGESQRPFHILQSLYDQTCSNQSTGDDEGYEYMAKIFLKCFQTYLKPIRTWMATGEIGTHVRVMFVKKSDEGVSLQSLWQDQHRLAYNADGTLNAPQFLHVAGKKIFNTGKSINFLKQLGLNDALQTSQADVEPSMTYESVCQASEPFNLSPFPELFDTAFAQWTASKHHSSSTLLRDQLESRCGLRRSLEALEYIYFYRNGALSNSIVYPLFEKIERGKQCWNDAFTTIDLFHEAFSSIDCIDVERLSVQPASSGQISQNKQRLMTVLEGLNIVYALPWPVANIVRPESITMYQRVFILLTQIQRAKFLLQRYKLLAKASSTFYAVHVNLLWFVNTLLSHLTTLVITVNTMNMRYDMSRAEDVDAMIAVHQAYIAVLEDQCFLAKKHASLKQALVSILDLAIFFSDLHAESLGLQTQHSPKPTTPVSSADDEDDTKETPEPARNLERSGAQPTERLTQMHETYTQLLAIVTSAVEGASKADGGPVWEILSGNLSLGATG